MKNRLKCFALILLCFGTAVVYSDHNEDANNGGHSEWLRSYNSNLSVGKKYTDHWYKVASDSDDPMYANTSTETILVNIPALLNSRMTWKAKAEIRCKSNDYKGTYYIAASILVDGEYKDIDIGGAQNRYTPLEYSGKHKHHTDAYHFETKTNQGSYPHPSITASDCAASAQIYGRNYAVDIPYWKSAYSYIPW